MGGCSEGDDTGANPHSAPQNEMAPSGEDEVREESSDNNCEFADIGEIDDYFNPDAGLDEYFGDEHEEADQRDGDDEEDAGHDVGAPVVEEGVPPENYGPHGAPHTHDEVPNKDDPKWFPTFIASWGAD